MDPPPCIQNAMMTKDKKPFTYTPGGLNLSEIRSPRMARRLERNANYEGVTNVPQTSPQPHQPLPPSALAAMQPQMHVQVFPSGPPPPPPQPKCAIPPPPCGVPPPPPPPSQPLPTQKIKTGTQVVERPDMTKIIPENPMGLLRKTGGPKERNAVLEDMYKKNHPQSPQHQQFEPQYRQPPPTLQRVPSLEPQRPPQQRQQTPQSPPQRNQPPFQVPIARNDSPQMVNDAPKWKPPVIERQTQPPPASPTEKPQVPPKKFHVETIYIPVQNEQPAPERNVQSPKIQSPGTPTLKEAPKPWQVKPQNKQEVPEWARRDSEQATNQPPTPPQSRWPQTRPTIQLSSTQYQTPPGDFQSNQESHPNAVYVTQPLVLQHPGAGFGQPMFYPQPAQKPCNGQQQGNARVIPIQVEPMSPQPQGSFDRSLNRQQSWGSNPTQSNAFKRIQKITQTDQEEEENQPITEHSPKFMQNYQQDVGNQMRRMKIGGADGFKQGPSKNGGPQVRTIPIQIEGYGGHPYSETVPSKTFRVLQATTQDSCANANEINETNEHYDPSYWAYPMCPPYPVGPIPPPYWHYYYPPIVDQNDQDPRNARTPIPFWPPPYETPDARKTPDSDSLKSNRSTPVPYGYYDPYYYHYYYGYPPLYSPVPFGYPYGDPDGYSSMDELAFYTENKQNETQPQSNDVKPEESELETDSDTDTEVNEELPKKPERVLSSTGLQTIRSVPDIRVYENADSSSDEESVSDSDESVYEEDIPHQLSVIFEVSEKTDVFAKESSVLSDSTTVAEHEDDEVVQDFKDDNGWLALNMETVSRIESKINARIERDDEEVLASLEFDSPPFSPKRCSVNSDNDVKEENNQAISDEVQSSDSEDWWSIIGENDNLPKPNTAINYNNKENDCDNQCSQINSDKVINKDSDNEIDFWSLIQKDDIQKETSTGSSDSSFSLREEKDDKNGSTSSDSDESLDERDVSNDVNNNEEEEEIIHVPSIRDRIKALQESSTYKKPVLKINEIKSTVEVQETTHVTVTLKQEESVEITKTTKSLSSKSSVKSMEEYSEEDIDSGVTSDMSKHYSDNEEYPELRKMSKCQRVATHSRLYKLLQDEIELEEETIVESIQERKNQLTLPLDNINPTDKLATELIQSLLKQKKGQIFQSMSIDRLQAVAKKILEEDRTSETPSEGFSEFLSPLRSDTGNSTAAETPQEFYGHYNEYVQYYNTWEEAGKKVKCPRIFDRKLSEEIPDSRNSKPVTS